MTGKDTPLTNGLIVFREACQRARVDVASLIADTCLWVDPKTFQELPVWYPETYRGAPIYDCKWQRIYTNTSKSSGRTVEKMEPNIRAGLALWRALGFGPRSKPKNWTVCHIWGVDDEYFQRPNTIVRNPKYYSCVGNMVALPSPLKALTDGLPEIKRMLRVCAYYLYGWVCDADEVKAEASAITNGSIPDGYPESWPRKQGGISPKGMVRYNATIQKFLTKRKEEIGRDLQNPALKFYPKVRVREVLEFWRIKI